jgi:subtilisin family serine protease
VLIGLYKGSSTHFVTAWGFTNHGNSILIKDPWSPRNYLTLAQYFNAVYPACYDLPNVISVAAIDNQGRLYQFSGYGNKALVAAPGVSILSSMPEGDYTYSSGTSEATAFVSGIAALVKSYRPNFNSIQIADILKSGVKPIDLLKGKVKSGGIIDAYACLKNAEKLK